MGDDGGVAGDGGGQTGDSGCIFRSINMRCLLFFLCMVGDGGGDDGGISMSIFSSRDDGRINIGCDFSWTKKICCP